MQEEMNEKDLELYDIIQMCSGITRDGVLHGELYA